MGERQTSSHVQARSDLLRANTGRMRDSADPMMAGMAPMLNTMEPMLKLYLAGRQIRKEVELARAEVEA